MVHNCLLNHRQPAQYHMYTATTWY